MTPIENSSLFAEFRDWLEILYFASGIVIMVLVAFGLWQLKLAKDQLVLAKNQLKITKDIFKTQSKRAAVEAAVVECRRLSETLVQDSLALEKFCEDNNIKYFEDAVFTKTEDGFTIDTRNINKEDIKKLTRVEDIINRYLKT